MLSLGCLVADSSVTMAPLGEVAVFPMLTINHDFEAGTLQSRVGDDVRISIYLDLKLCFLIVWVA